MSKLWNGLVWLSINAFIIVVIYVVYSAYKNRSDTEHNNISSVQRAMDDANSAPAQPDDIKNIEYKISLLEVDNKNEIESVLKLKMALSLLRRAERDFVKAKNLHKVFYDNRDTSKPEANFYLTPEQHSLISTLSRSIISDYNEAKVYVETISYNGSSEYNYMLWYTKGCIYFRHLQLLSTPDNAEETFLNSLNAFKNSLKYKDKDLNSQINIELLLQQKEKMMAQAKKPREERVQQLTSPLVGASPNKGQF